uniref:Serpin domain-containing protein n=1 Tax=Laticauda laticaudata TaxID=8630 RepID=A0A8C5STQ1_LATLA
METLSAANTSFAVDFFKHLCKTQTNTNVLFSPWSISSVMATLYSGAKGHTAEQIAKVSFDLILTERFEKKTGFAVTITNWSKCYNWKPKIKRSSHKDLQINLHNIHSRFQALNQEINKSTKNVLLSNVNQLYGDKSVSFQRVSVTLVLKYYKVEPQTVNFQETADDARKEINEWVEQQTAGKFQIFGQAFIKKLAFLTLSLTIFYSMQHAYTLPDDHHDDSTGLEMLENKLTYEAFSKWTSPKEMEEVEANVHLPKMQLNIHYELKPLLTNMGITDAFNAEMADFTGVSAESNLGVSQIFHKCFVDINEEGTEAAASTAGSIDGRSDQGAILFAADHPFLFFIRHNKTKNILFWGKFCSP